MGNKLVKGKKLSGSEKEKVGFFEDRGMELRAY